MSAHEYTEPLWTPEETAEHLNVSVSVLQKWRQRGYGPPWIPLVPGRGGLIRYSPHAVRGWLAVLAEGERAALVGRATA